MNKDRAKTINWPSVVTELHAHLGGSVPLYRLWEIGIDRGIRGLGSGYHQFLDTLKIDRSRVSDLDTYLEVYDRVELIQSGPQAVRESVIIAIHRAFRTGGALRIGPGGEEYSKPLFNIGKLELRFNPLKRTGAVFLKGSHAGLYDVDRVIKAAVDAVEEVELGFKNSIKVGLLFCLGRDMAPEANQVLAKKTATWADKTDKIVGIDLAGPESKNPLSDPDELAKMKSVFNLIPRSLGKTIHVGETPHVNLETFLRTVDALEPHRVAHPIVAFRSLIKDGDERGVNMLKDRDITCEFCVQSNLLTKAVESLEEYKEIIKVCDSWRIPYTFSTDAPSLQGSTLAEELMMLINSGAATEEQVLDALRTADRKSFIRNGH